MIDLSLLPCKSSKSRAGRSGILGLKLIGVLKMGQGLFLAALSVGLLHLVNKALDEEVARGLLALHLDLDSPWIQRLLDRLAFVNHRQLRILSVGSGVYAGLLMIEGTGLYLRRSWGEYFTLGVTGSFLPLELYECLKGLTVVKLVIILFNTAVLVYLLVRVLQKHGAYPHVHSNE